jgi:hypothetical protein
MPDQFLVPFRLVILYDQSVGQIQEDDIIMLDRDRNFLFFLLRHAGSEQQQEEEYRDKISDMFHFLSMF